MTSVVCYKGILATDSKILVSCTKANAENVTYGTKIRILPGIVLGFCAEMPTDSELSKLKEHLPKLIIKKIKGETIPLEELTCLLGKKGEFSFVGLYSISIDGVLYQGTVYDDAIPYPVLMLGDRDQLLARGSGEDLINYCIHAGFPADKAVEIAIENDRLSGGQVNIETLDDIPVFEWFTPESVEEVENVA